MVDISIPQFIQNRIGITWSPRGRILTPDERERLYAELFETKNVLESLLKYLDGINNSLTNIENELNGIARDAKQFQGDISRQVVDVLSGDPDTLAFFSEHVLKGDKKSPISFSGLTTALNVIGNFNDKIEAIKKAKKTVSSIGVFIQDDLYMPLLEDIVELVKTGKQPMSRRSLGDYYQNDKIDERISGLRDRYIETGDVLVLEEIQNILYNEFGIESEIDVVTSNLKAIRSIEEERALLSDTDEYELTEEYED